MGKTLRLEMAMTPSDSPPPKQSPNVWKWVGIGCGGLLIVGIGAIAALVFFVQRTVNMSFDSDSAEQVANDIIDFEIPGGSEGFMSMDMGMFKMAGVLSATNPEGTILLVGQISEAAMQGDPEAMERAMQESMEDQSGGFQVQEQRLEPRELCGQTVQATILEGEQTVGGQTVPALTYQAFTTHNGEGIFVSLTTSGNDAETQANSIWDSLACK